MPGRSLQRARELATNAWITASTVAHHVTDDPVVFCLQVSRRLPSRVVRPLAAGLSRLPADTFPAARGTGLHILGNDDAAAATLRTASRSAGAAVCRRCAEVALTMGEVPLTEALLAELPHATRGAAATRARVAWHHGNVDGAVGELEAARAGGTATNGERALLKRLCAERDLLGSFEPELPLIGTYEPRPDTVLYAVTNSLPHTASGYAQRTHSLLSAIRDEGWDVHAVTRPGYPVQVGKILARGTDVVDGIPYHRILPLNLAPTVTGRVQQHAEALLSLALEVRPSVLHTTTHYVNALAVRAVAEALCIPWTYEVRGLLADTWASTRAPSALTSGRYERFQSREAQALQSASDVVTLGTHMADRVREIAGDSSLSVRLAPNGVGGAFTDEPGEKASARRRTGLPPDRFLVGTVTSVVDYEGLDDLARAVDIARESVPSILAVIVGDGVARPGLQQLVSDLGIQDQVTFCGRVDRSEAVEYFRSLDVFVVPRKDRTVTRAVTPLKPVEALASRTAVVASDLPALREVIEHGVTGLLTPPDDPESLAATLVDLARDASLRNRLAEAGREWALENRTWAVTAKETVKRYGEMTGRTPAPQNDRILPPEETRERQS
ncbi:glycosyltransferase family 4 protein [Kocuria carniphila]|uniref:glycosyltransferase family 4 protein n=1 Tax=Kocuria carniphila TaxID=262208 RepID=UPI0028E95BFE|nr:glycosyltransferase family 4 protein [Kocuria carniphila]